MAAPNREEKRCTVEVHVGSREAGDVREALLLREATRATRGCVACEVHLHRRFGHAVVRDLRDNGTLDQILKRAIACDPACAMHS